jgi:hypothetical protein
LSIKIPIKQEKIEDHESPDKQRREWTVLFESSFLPDYHPPAPAPQSIE